MSQLLQNAVCGTAMILAVAVLRWALKDRLSPGARLALWAVCLFRLLTPAAPESVLSLWGLGQRLTQGTQAVSLPPPAVPVSNGAGAPAITVPETATPAPAPVPGAAEIPWGAVLMGIWLAVGMVLAVRYVLSWRRTRRAVLCAIPVGRDDSRYRLLPKSARLREGPVDGAPLTFGAVRPTVVLSPGLDGAELECVLAHESIHAQRRDNLWHYAMAAALAVFWWNPAVWLMSRLLRRDIELSCDRAALKKLGADRRADYANALVSLAAAGSDPAFCQTFGRKAVEERIRSIMKYKKMTVAGTALSLALVLGLTAGFASNPAQPDGPDSDVYDSERVGAAIQMTGSGISDNQKVEVNIVDPDDVDLSGMEERLAQLVAAGRITQEEADTQMASAEELVEQACRDGLKVFMDGSGGILGVGDSSGTIPLGIATLRVGGDSGSPMGELGSGIYTYDFVMPEDSAAGVVGYVAHEYCAAADCDITELHYHENGHVIYVHYENPFDEMQIMNTDQYKALLNKLVADGKMPQEDADCFYTEAKQWLERGNSGGGVSNLFVDIENGSYAVMGASACTMPGCGNQDAHEHNGVMYYAHDGSYTLSAEPEPPRSAIGGGDAATSIYTVSPGDDWIPAIGTNGEEGYVRQSEIGHAGYPGTVNNPEEAMAYMEWLETQPEVILVPLYDAEGNVIGQFGISNQRGQSAGAACPVCTVDGCTIEGRHTHDGVTYCGGEGHHGDTCDGSCLYCAQHAMESGHHGTASGSHHGNGHH